MNPRLLQLAWRAVWHTPLITLLLAACIAVSTALPVGASFVLQGLQGSLRERAAATPLIVGPEASRFDLVFTALSFRATTITGLPASFSSELDRTGVRAIPLHTGTIARGLPVVGTTDDYYAARSLRIQAGEAPLLLGDVALGAHAARRLGLGVGDALRTETRRGLDLATAIPVTLNIVGVFAPNGTQDDNAAFTTLQSAWFAGGLIHGHEDAAGQDSAQALIGRTSDHVSLTQAVPTAPRVTEENRSGFHAHGDPNSFPITCFVLFPTSEKERTILAARLNALEGVRVVRPVVVIDEVLATIMHLKRVFDVAAAGLAVVTLLFLLCVAGLTARLRSAEMRTLREIGANRWTPISLYSLEIMIVVTTGLIIAAALVPTLMLVFERYSGWV